MMASPSSTAVWSQRTPSVGPAVVNKSTQTEPQRPEGDQVENKTPDGAEAILVGENLLNPAVKVRRRRECTINRAGVMLDVIADGLALGASPSTSSRLS